MVALQQIRIIPAVRLLASCALIVAPAISAAETAQPLAVRLLNARCTSCHGQTLTLAFASNVLDEGGTEALDRLLTDHHAPDAEARSEIVTYLAQQVSGAED